MLVSAESGNARVRGEAVAVALTPDSAPYGARSAARARTIDRVALKSLLRRWLNVAIAAVMIVALMPLMVLIGILVKLTSPGPILYTQARVGVDRRWNRVNNTNHRRVVDHGGQLFRIYKFRTMYVQQHGVQKWASKNDPRVTPIGRFLRRYRLDE